MDGKRRIFSLEKTLEDYKVDKSLNLFLFQVLHQPFSKKYLTPNKDYESKTFEDKEPKVYTIVQSTIPNTSFDITITMYDIRSS